MCVVLLAAFVCAAVGKCNFVSLNRGIATRVLLRASPRPRLLSDVPVLSVLMCVEAVPAAVDVQGPVASNPLLHLLVCERGVFSRTPANPLHVATHQEHRRTFCRCWWWRVAALSAVDNPERLPMTLPKSGCWLHTVLCCCCCCCASPRCCTCTPTAAELRAHP